MLPDDVWRLLSTLDCREAVVYRMYVRGATQDNACVRLCDLDAPRALQVVACRLSLYICYVEVSEV